MCVCVCVCVCVCELEHLNIDQQSVHAVVDIVCNLHLRATGSNPVRSKVHSAFHPFVVGKTSITRDKLFMHWDRSSTEPCNKLQ